ncbi:MAG: phosphoribosyltransferase [Candidatus Velthaea sp.]
MAKLSLWPGGESPKNHSDRSAAGRALAVRLRRYAARDTLVLALPRGGVPVAAEIARELDARLDVFLVRKLGAPNQPELAIGAIATGGIRLLNHEIIATLRIDAETLAGITAAEERELARREARYRAGRPRLDVAGATIVLVDDGAATGASMRVALEALRPQLPRWITVALPVAAPEVVHALASLCDDLVCLVQPSDLQNISRWYDDFQPVSDDEVRALLARETR